MDEDQQAISSPKDEDQQAVSSPKDEDQNQNPQPGDETTNETEMEQETATGQEGADQDNTTEVADEGTTAEEQPVPVDEQETDGQNEQEAGGDEPQEERPASAQALDETPATQQDTADETQDQPNEKRTPSPQENTQEPAPGTPQSSGSGRKGSPTEPQQAELERARTESPTQTTQVPTTTPAPSAPQDSPVGRALGAASPQGHPTDGVPAPPTPPEQSLGRAAAPPPPEELLGRAGAGLPPPQPTQDPLPEAEGHEPGRIPTAPPMPSSDTKESLMEDISALSLTWSFGMSRSVPVTNLTDDQRKMIGYACAHTGVLYDLKENKQQLLQGHSNAITATCVSGDRRWFATADIGPDNLIIVWDTCNGNPVRTIFCPHPDGVIGMAMTPDARYLASISAGGLEEKQTLAIWDWTVESETPLCTAELDPSYGLQCYVLFNPEDTSQIVTNSDSQVIFFSWNSGQIEYYAPPLTDEDFNKPVGKYSQSIFLSNTSRALTATSNGNLVVWDTNKPLTKVVSNEMTPDKKALKLVKLQERGINVITTTEQFIVTADVLGHVKFFDQTLKLMNWYQDFHLGPINSLTFACSPEFGNKIKPANEFPPDATIKAKKFYIRDFVIGTTNAVFAHCTTDGTNVEVIHRDHDAPVHGLDSHPTEPKIVVGSYSGILKVWDYNKKEVIVSRHFDRGQMIRCCTYDPNGDCIAVGFTNGCLRIVDATTLDDLLPRPFHYARDAITHIAFSHDSRYLATADAEYTTSVFMRDFRGEGPYAYVGRHRAHYKMINSLLFGVQLDGEAPRLLSLSEDRHLVEYDLENSNKDELRITSRDRIEQSAVPFCMTWYPPITKESFLLTANDQFKLKMYNSTTKMCRKTLLGPTYGTPIQQLLVLPTADPVTDKRYMAYITDDKIGLHIMPLDGNPHNSMALITNPQGVARLISSNDGKYLFTAGGVDATVHMWKVNINALEAQAKLGGDDLIPFYGLLDGGRDGDFFRELEDYFYYAQIRSQGVDTTEHRTTSTMIPVSEVPFVMRALGFYPSEQEIEDMKNEVKFSNYVESGKYTTDIDLGDLIKLYINHRPAFGLQASKLQWAFETLGLPLTEGAIIDRGDLLDMLQNRGEHVKEYDLAEYLMTLLGFTDEGGSSELHQFDTEQAGSLIEEHLPQDITAESFANHLLGFGLYNSNVLNVEAEGSVQMA